MNHWKSNVIFNNLHPLIHLYLFVFNYSELHFSEVASFKSHTLGATKTYTSISIHWNMNGLTYIHLRCIHRNLKAGSRHLLVCLLEWSRNLKILWIIIKARTCNLWKQLCKSLMTLFARPSGLPCSKELTILIYILCNLACKTNEVLSKWEKDTKNRSSSP